MPDMVLNPRPHMLLHHGRPGRRRRSAPPRQSAALLRGSTWVYVPYSEPRGIGDGSRGLMALGVERGDRARSS